MNIPIVYQGWAHGKGLISSLIMLFDRVEYEGRKVRADVSHTYLRFDFPGGPDLIYESHLNGVAPSPRKHLLNAVKDGRVEFIREAMIDCDDTQRTTLWNEACSLHGDHYDLLHIFGLLIAIDIIGREKERIPKWMFRHNNKKFTCNEFVQRVMYSASLDPNVNPITGKRTATRATSSPESQFLARFGMPSKIYFATHDPMVRPKNARKH